MVSRVITLAALAGVALAQTSGDLVTVLNGTEGALTISQAVSENTAFLEAIAGKTNLTFLAPNDTAIAQFLNSSAGKAIEDAGEDAGGDYLLNLLLYHTINGGYDNVTDYYVAHTLLTSSNYTNVTGGQNIGFYYDDDEDIVAFYGAFDLESTAAATPIPFAQGWIYVLDGVLGIPPSVSEVVVSEDFNGTSFVAALEKTGLTEQIDTLHDATYFVPLDEGWATVEDALSQLSTDKLAEVLKYHVAAGKVWLFDEWVNGSQVTTVQGQTLTLTQTPDEEWFVNNAGVSYVDLMASEGVIVFIDNVLNPFEPYAPPQNGTDGDGVPAWPTSEASDASSTASATATAATATYTGAATQLKAGAAGVAALFGGVALALAL